MHNYYWNILIFQQIIDLKAKHGTVCDASTVLNLLKQCQSLQDSASLLVSRITSHGNAVHDTQLLSDVKQCGPKLSRITQDITDATRELYVMNYLIIK